VEASNSCIRTLISDSSSFIAFLCYFFLFIRLFAIFASVFIAFSSFLCLVFYHPFFFPVLFHLSFCLCFLFSCGVSSLDYKTCLRLKDLVVDVDGFVYCC
jgi:hypothetical protein